MRSIASPEGARRRPDWLRRLGTGWLTWIVPLAVAATSFAGGRLLGAAALARLFLVPLELLLHLAKAFVKLLTEGTRRNVSI